MKKYRIVEKNEKFDIEIEVINKSLFGKKQPNGCQLIRMVTRFI